MAATSVARRCANSIPSVETRPNIRRISDLAIDFILTYLQFSIHLPCIAIDVARA
jgi:hypothetical protein